MNMSEETSPTVSNRQTPRTSVHAQTGHAVRVETINGNLEVVTESAGTRTTSTPVELPEGVSDLYTKDEHVFDVRYVNGGVIVRNSSVTFTNDITITNL